MDSMYVQEVDPFALEVEEKFGCWYPLKRWLGLTKSKEKRTIYLSGATIPRNFPSNKLNN